MTTRDAVEKWWAGLLPGERDDWKFEAGSEDPAVCFKLYWSRGPMLTEADREVLTRGHCPVCCGRGFVIGPQGGASTNVECAQITCRARFNVVWMSGTALIGHHLGSGATAQPWPSEPQEREADA